jgi:hypothetical protein
VPVYESTDLVPGLSCEGITQRGLSTEIHIPEEQLAGQVHRYITNRSFLFLPLRDHVLRPPLEFAYAEGAEAQARGKEGRGLWLEVCGCGFSIGMVAAGTPISVRVGTAKSFFGPTMDLYWSSLPAVWYAVLKSGSGAGTSWSMEDKSTTPGSGSDFGEGRGLVVSPSVLAAFCTYGMLIVGPLPFFLTSSWVSVPYRL